MMTPKEFMEKTLGYWESYFEAFQDMPDGAWFQAHVDTFESDAVRECCEALNVAAPEGDGYDLTHAYLEAIDRARSE